MRKTIFSRDHGALLALLRKVREERGFSQAVLASRLDVTQSFVSKCERGERRLDIVELRAWCAALGISLRAFVVRFERACSREIATTGKNRNYSRGMANAEEEGEGS
jgi:transcriptional regulator with XRE-family HTH domain